MDMKSTNTFQPFLMKPFHRWIVVSLCIPCLLRVVLAQGPPISVQGQIFLPTGQPIQEVTRFTLTSDDPRVDTQYHFTDGQGRFILPGLRALKHYTLVVESDGRRFATTTLTFYAQPRGYVVVSLLPFEKERGAQPEVVSVGKLARPPSKKALKLYQEALDQIRKGNTKPAEDKLRQAIETDPEFVNAYNELAVLQMGKKDYAAAETILRQALQKEPEALHLLLNLGVSLNYLTRHREAIEPLRRVLEQSPDLLVAHVNLGIALLETDQITEVEAHLVRGTKADGREQALAYLYLGKLYAQTGDIPKAVEAWKTYLRIDPKSPNAEQIRTLLAQLGHPVEKP
jgi:tetratricopeptide (TPR) repeat protein